MSDTPILILDHECITQKLRRMAFQIYEANHNEKEIVVVAVERNGRMLAERIIPMLREVANFEIKQLNISIDKRNPLAEPTLDGDGSVMSGQSVVLIDDVLNSGRTLMYASRYVLNWPVDQLVTAVLVDRRHRKFPIRADFAGLTLSTTLQDHINVKFDDGRDAVYLE